MNEAIKQKLFNAMHKNLDRAERSIDAQDIEHYTKAVLNAAETLVALAGAAQVPFSLLTTDETKEGPRQ